MSLRKKFSDIITLIQELDFGISIMENAEMKSLDETVKSLSAGREVKFIDVPFKVIETKSMDAEYGEIKIKGIASTATIDRYGDIVLQEGITFSKYASGKLPIPYMHDTYDIRGQWEVYEVRDGQLWVEGTLRNPITPEEKVLHDNIRSGAICSLSIGFFVTEARMDVVDGHDIRVFVKSEVFEISVVVVPANPDAYFQISKSFTVTKSADAESLPAAQEEEINTDKGEEKPAEVQVNPLEQIVSDLQAELQSLKDQLTENESLKSQLADALKEVQESDELIGALSDRNDSLVEELKMKKGIS